MARGTARGVGRRLSVNSNARDIALWRSICRPRRDLMDPAKMTWEMYADSVVRFIEDRDLKNVILAGHSLGGLTISAVAERIPKRIKRVIWVSAMVMLDGEVPAADLERENYMMLKRW